VKASDDKLKNACHFALNVLKAPGAQKNSIVLELCDSSPPGHVKEAKGQQSGPTIIREEKG